MTDPHQDPSLPADLFERSQTMLAHAHLSGELAVVNQAWSAGFAREVSALTGVALADLAVPDDHAAVAEQLERAAGGAGPGGGEHRFTRGDGAVRLLRWHAVPARDGAGLHLDAHDITADRAAADAALAELDALAASVSHDLRAPLRAIDGFSEILLADPESGLPEQTRRFLALVRSAGSDLAELFDDLLAVVRAAREPLELVDDIDPALLANEVVDAVLRPRQGDRDVTWVIGDVPLCRADARLLRRLLEALLDNALKFTAPHPTARIEFGFDEATGAYLVRDDGVGFDDALSDTAFRIFGRLHGREAFGGSGIGLAVAARVAARHGGRLWAESAAGAGATLRFTLGPVRTASRSGATA
jgi:two-component system sensor kinase